MISEIQATEILRNRSRLNEILAHHTGKTVEEIAQGYGSRFLYDSRTGQRVRCRRRHYQTTLKLNRTTSSSSPTFAASFSSARTPKNQNYERNKMPIVPYVVDNSGREERVYDIYSRLLKDRIIFLGTQVNADVANSLVAQMLFLQSEDPKADIHLYINSPGGSVVAGMAIYDTMQFLTCDVATYCIGHAASMGGPASDRRCSG